MKPDAAQVRAQLDRILASSGFHGANRRARLLRYLVEHTLDERSELLKESVIANEVFERAPDYDPHVDSVVRVEVGRLRSRLIEYYAQEGLGEGVRIEIPKGGYRAVFELRNGAAAAVHPSRPRWRWVAACAVGLAALAGVAWWAGTRIEKTPTSIAVLPFLNLSGDPANEYLGDGISEELTEALAQSPVLRVVARTSAFQYKGKAADVREIGEKLGAGALLEGSVMRRGEALHVVAQLIRARDRYHLWSGAYDGGAAELPSMEEQIARTVRARLNASGAGAAPQTALAKDPEAHDLYLRAAFEFSRRSAASARHAIELARQAAKKDPAYAQPYVLMAAAESQLTTLLVESPHEAAGRARQDIAKALELDPESAAAHAQKAMLEYTDRWDWPQAEREFKLALATGSHGSAENLYGWCLITRGRLAEAKAHLQIAAELDPLSLGPQLNQVEELLAERDVPGATRKVEGILGIAPANFAALGLRAGIALYRRDCADATNWNQKILRQYPQLPFAHLNDVGTDSVCGRHERAAAHLAEVLRGDPPGYLSPFVLGLMFAANGEADRSISYLQKSAELREPTILYLKVEGTFDKMRQDKRFVELERRVGLMD